MCEEKEFKTPVFPNVKQGAKSISDLFENTNVKHVIDKIQHKVEACFETYSKEFADSVQEEGCKVVREISTKVNTIMGAHDKLREFFLKGQNKNYYIHEVYNLEAFIIRLNTMIYQYNLGVECENKAIQIHNNSYFSGENPLTKVLKPLKQYLDLICPEAETSDIDFPAIELVRAKLISLNTQIYLIDVEDKTEDEIKLYIDTCIRHNLEYNSLVDLSNPGKPANNRKIVFIYTFDSDFYGQLDEKYNFPLNKK